MLRINTGYYLGILTPETMKLLGSNKSKITKDNNGEDVSILETNEVVLVHCNIVNNDSRKVLFRIHQKFDWLKQPQTIQKN